MTILTRVNIALGVMLAFFLGLAVAMDVDYTKPNVEFLPNMKRSPASSAFAANTVFRNSRTLQSSVTGTIPRGDLPLYYSATKEEAVRAGEELQNPMTVAIAEAEKTKAAVDTSSASDASEVATVAQKAKSVVVAPDPQAMLAASVQRGAKAYGIFCVSCHGSAGAGDGPVAKRGFPPPPSLTTGKSVQMKDGQLFHIMTYGQGSMPSMKVQLSRKARWDAVNYVRSLQTAAAVVQPVRVVESADAVPQGTPVQDSDATSTPPKSEPESPAAPEVESSKETEEVDEAKS